MTYQDFNKLSEGELDEVCARAEGLLIPTGTKFQFRDGESECGKDLWKRPGVAGVVTLYDLLESPPNYIDSDGLTVHGLRLAKKAVEKALNQFMQSLYEYFETRIGSEGRTYIYATAFVRQPKAILFAAINALVSTSGVREE